MFKFLVSKKLRHLQGGRLSDVFNSLSPKTNPNSPWKTAKLKKNRKENLEIVLTACRPHENTIGVVKTKQKPSDKVKSATNNRSRICLATTPTSKFSSSRLTPRTPGKCARAHDSSVLWTPEMENDTARASPDFEQFDSSMFTISDTNATTPIKDLDFITNDDQDISNSSMIVNISPPESRIFNRNAYEEQKKEVSLHMALYDAQLERVKRRTQILLERNTEIRERYERVRKKAKLLHLDSDLNYIDTAVGDLANISALRNDKYNSTGSTTSDNTSDIHGCAETLNLAESERSFSRHSPLRTHVTLARTRYSSRTSPKRLSQLKTRSPRRTSSNRRPMTLSMSPLVRGLKTSKKTPTSNRDIILNTLMKDTREHTVC